jgi:catechol 2,3-dioxygenase-like lactoylglutathione lyase family enzyme
MLNSSKIIAFLLTTDYARARSFYVDTLGLEFVSQDHFALALRGNGNMIRVVKSEKFNPAQYTVLGWEVSNIESAVGDLMNKGINFEKFPWVKDERGLGIWTAPNGDQVAWFKDPDGNLLSLSEHKQP